jgi:hypothetical protein
VRFIQWEKSGKIACMILDRTNWTFWLIALVLNKANAEAEAGTPQLK